MMMEEEIERTKEEIRGIEEACDKVELVLAKVTKGERPLRDGSVEGIIAKEGGEDKMEDVVHEALSIGDDAPAAKIAGGKWFEDEKLLDLWNGSTT
jgi:hypothetical protein